jgi:hypothetical protein
VPSADQFTPSARHHADFTFAELVAAYFDCRRTKRNTASALAFEVNLERNLGTLDDELRAGTYAPGRSICFVITRPKSREVWAADFRDRIVHHLLYNRVAARFHAMFIADSCACIPGRGTLYAAQRLESKIRSATENWTKPVHYLKCDLANFFVTINKPILFGLLARHIPEPWWLDLAGRVLFHDVRENFQFRGNPKLLEKVPPHKRLINQSAENGLPIGNLSSQFLANVYLNELDQRAKHVLRSRHYIRYVDDFLFLGEPGRLNEILADLDSWLPAALAVRLNPSKTILQPVDRGVDFVGQVIKPHHRYTRRRTYREALSRVESLAGEALFVTANSYFGVFGQATGSHHDRARLANILRRRGHSINKQLTQTYRRA